MVDFFGIGGGFIAGSLMFWMGVPMNFVVGTDLAYKENYDLIILGTSQGSIKLT